MSNSNQFGFQIDDDSNLVSAVFRGKHNAETIISCISKVHDNQCFKNKPAAVFDMQDAELSESYGDLLQMIDFTNLLGNSRGPSRWAFVSNNSSSSEFLDRFIVLTGGDNRIQIRRFNRDTEAKRWVNSYSLTRLVPENHPLVSV